MIGKLKKYFNGQILNDHNGAHILSALAEFFIAHFEKSYHVRIGRET